MLKAILIDEEASVTSTLKLLIEHCGLIKVVASAGDGETGIALVEDYKPEIIFLHICLPSMNGFELIRRLSHRHFKLVVTNTHREYALEAIKNKAFDYLLKPIDAGELQTCIERLLSELIPASIYGLIELLVKDGIIYIRQCDIIRLEASRSYTVFYLDDGTKHIGSKNLKEYTALLDPAIFYRCHHSHVVNLKKVKRFINHEGFFAKMSNGSLADISKKHKDTFLEKMKSY